MNKEIINQFYKSFAKADIEGMLDCYSDDILFEDPAFGVLKGERAKNMWRMLLSRGSDLKVSFSNVENNGNKGAAIWSAEYLYGPKKRKVINNIVAKFEFSDGKIIKHTDQFNLWKWTQQALGISGYLLGWSAFMKYKIQEKLKNLLDNYSKEN